MQLWGKSVEFWDAVTLALMWAAAISGAVAAFTGLAGAIISRQTSAIIQRASDERIAAADALAAKSNAAAADAALRLEQLRREVGPRRLQREIFLDALRRQPSSPVEILYLRDDPECFELAQQVWRALQDAHWQVIAPQPIPQPAAHLANASPMAMTVDGQPSGVTVVAHSITEQEALAPQDKMLGRPWTHTPFTVLLNALTDSLGQGASNAGGPNRPPQGTLRVVVAPR